MDDTEEPVDIDIELRVVTAASVWLIRPDQYMRMPRGEQPRRPPSRGALTDRIWHSHRGVSRITDDHNHVRYRILPVDHALGGHGVVTGDVIADSSAGSPPAVSPRCMGPEQTPATSRTPGPRNGT